MTTHDTAEMNQLPKERVAAPRPTVDLSAVASGLQTRLWGRVHGLQLRWRDQGVVVRGFSRSYYGKQVAQHLVMQATGLPIAANEIEVATA